MPAEGPLGTGVVATRHVRPPSVEWNPPDAAPPPVGHQAARWVATRHVALADRQRDGVPRVEGLDVPELQIRGTGWADLLPGPAAVHGAQHGTGRAARPRHVPADRGEPTQPRVHAGGEHLPGGRRVGRGRRGRTGGGEERGESDSDRHRWQPHTGRSYPTGARLAPPYRDTRVNSNVYRDARYTWLPYSTTRLAWS